MQITIPCRFCSEPLTHIMCDLGMSPLANSYIKFQDSRNVEKLYPLKVWICNKCLLAQIEGYGSPETIFGEYLYFSSYSTTWLEHANIYCEMIINRFGLSQSSRVVEIASNDGYLLQYFLAKGMNVIGIEPAANIAKIAIFEKNIPTIVKFFGSQTASDLVATYTSADLLIGNNVLAHVPDINDFVSGLKIALNSNGVITLEFPHLVKMMSGHQFDTIYHEHYSYLSFLAVEKILATHALTIFDVEELPTHGGSLRIFARHSGCNEKKLIVTDKVTEMRKLEIECGLHIMQTYTGFGDRVKTCKREILKFLIKAKDEEKSVVAYGAAAKGVTLLNYCGIHDDFIDYVVDKSPHKQNHFMPGVRIPIFEPQKILETKPDYVLLLPWNLKNEVSHDLSFMCEWGGKLVLPIPKVTILD